VEGGRFTVKEEMVERRMCQEELNRSERGSWGSPGHLDTPEISKSSNYLFLG
jgi:hypothetical protein